MKRKIYSNQPTLLSASIKPNGEAATLTIEALNSKGTVVQTKVEIPFYFFSYLVRDMNKALSDKVETLRTYKRAMYQNVTL